MAGKRVKRQAAPWENRNQLCYETDFQQDWQGWIALYSRLWAESENRNKTLHGGTRSNSDKRKIEQGQNRSLQLYHMQILTTEKAEVFSTGSLLNHVCLSLPKHLQRLCCCCWFGLVCLLFWFGLFFYKRNWRNYGWSTPKIFSTHPQSRITVFELPLADMAHTVLKNFQWWALHSHPRRDFWGFDMVG